MPRTKVQTLNLATHVEEIEKTEDKPYGDNEDIE